jgi:5'-3' exonuclease
MDKILLIDGLNAMWRASIGFAPKKTPAPPSPSGWVDNGLPSALTADEWTMVGDSLPPEPEPPADDYVLIFNFFRNLRPIIELFSPDKCFFVLEGHPQFRYDLFADYKANRLIKQASKSKEEMDKFLSGKDEIVRLMQLLPITTARAAKYEADDVIASLCHDMRNESLTVLSNDSDYIQLLQRGYANCRIYNPIKKTFMKAPLYPYVAWKCLAGDKSDSIPALVKPKKVEELTHNPALFQQFMSVEENRANFSLNRQLIEFRPVPLEEIDFHDGVRSFPTLREEFRRMRFESIINDRSWDKYINTFNCLKY